ncbi:MAG: hypothetical protein FWG94_05780 [Oscillospiraceae bacterium]|nr:hypothetical protein [Oscillospiraceae bacterium]
MAVFAPFCVVAGGHGLNRKPLTQLYNLDYHTVNEKEYGNNDYVSFKYKTFAINKAYPLPLYIGGGVRPYRIEDRKIQKRERMSAAVNCIMRNRFRKRSNIKQPKGINQNESSDTKFHANNGAVRLTEEDWFHHLQGKRTFQRNQ